MSTHQLLAEFPSKSSSAIHKVQLDLDKNIIWCSCTGWRNRRKGKPYGCTHTVQVLAQLTAQSYVIQPTDEHTFVYANGTAVSAPLTMPAPAPAFTPSAALPALAEVKTGKRAPGSASAAPASASGASGVTSAFITPMLASAPLKDKKIEEYGKGWYAEIKMDGHRLCLLVAEGKAYAWSRFGKARPLPTHLEKDVLKLRDGYYDGEIVGPGGRSWNVSAGSNKGDEELVLFDCLHLMGASLLTETYEVRRRYLESAMADVPTDSLLRISAQLPVKTSTVEKLWAEGKEGLILKKGSSLYKPGHRSDEWIKIKNVIDVAVTITGFAKGENGPYSVAKVVDDQGVAARVKVPTLKLLRTIEKDPASWTGRRIEMSAQELTDGKSYRHPRWHHAVGSDE